MLGALEKLNPHKATGHDLVLPKVLRMVADQVASPATHIYNEIISLGTWPEQWTEWGDGRLYIRRMTRSTNATIDLLLCW